MADYLHTAIPLDQIEKIQIYMNTGKKSLSKIKSETKADYIINGTLYNMSTWKVVCHMKVDGIVLDKPNYQLYGYAWNKGSDIALKLLPNVNEINYISCNCLIRNYKYEDIHYTSAQGGIRGRTAIGTKEGKLCLYCSKDGCSEAKTPETLQRYLLKLGWKDAVMLDGGGSSQCDFLGEKITSSRAVQHLILVYTKKETEIPKGEPSMTEQEIRCKVVSTAISYLGCKESDGSHKKIIDIYNAHKPLARNYAVQYTDAWCATFVSAISILLGYTDIMPTECSCTRMIELYKTKNRWIENDAYTPKIGDIIMYDWSDNGIGDDTNAPDHVGIVTGVTGSTITIIEGNKNESVAYRTMQANGRFIRGYCTPDYASKATSTTETVNNSVYHLKRFIEDVQRTFRVNVDGIAGAETLRKTVTVSAFINRSHAVVKYIQMRLYALGYKEVGDVDGIVGQKFTAAVKRYQKDNGCVSDGIITARNKTWKKLLGME